MDKLDILLGKPLLINGITVRNPKMSDVFDVGEDKYMSIINIFTLKPSDMMVELYDIGINYTKTTPFELFILLCGETVKKNRIGELEWEEDNEISRKIGWLTGIYDFHIYSEEPFFLKSDSTGLVIDESIYGSIRKFLMYIHRKKEKEKYNPGNDSTFKFLIEEERRKIKRLRRKERESFFEPIVSCLVWIGNKSYEEVCNMFVSQCFDGIERIGREKEYDNICFGYYSGNMKQKDFKAIIEDVNWTN